MSFIVPVTPEVPALSEEAEALARRWNLPFETDSSARHRLVLTHTRLQLQQFGEDAPGPIWVDFIGGAVGHRRRFGGGRGQPIAKAVGLGKGEPPRVVDATAGLGRDAFVLASLGCTVTLMERSPLAAALLENGLKNAAQDAEVAPIASRMRLVHGDAVTMLRDLSQHERPDVVYLDPMFPHRDSSALVKKEMRLFQALLGHDADADALLPAALAAARVRVVVKRPGYAPGLAGIAPTLAYATKNHRFDTYVIKALV